MISKKPKNTIAKIHCFVFSLCLMLTFACETEPLEPIAQEPEIEDTTTADTTANDSVITDSNACDTADYSFSGFIVPLLTDNGCKGCHQGSVPSGGVGLDDYTGVKAAVDNGSLLGSISHANGFSNMPKGGNKLDSCSIAKVELWINGGAKND